MKLEEGPMRDYFKWSGSSGTVDYGPLMSSTGAGWTIGEFIPLISILDEPTRERSYQTPTREQTAVGDMHLASPPSAVRSS
jgi:hypothetical protein